MTPLMMVVRELTEQCGSMSEQEYEEAIRGVIKHLHDRAYDSLKDKKVDEKEALRNSKEYCALAQLVSTFGTALIAMEDIEDDLFDLPTDLDPDDDGSGGRMN